MPRRRNCRPRMTWRDRAPVLCIRARHPRVGARSVEYPPQLRRRIPMGVSASNGYRRLDGALGAWPSVRGDGPPVGAFPRRRPRDEGDCACADG